MFLKWVWVSNLEAGRCWWLMVLMLRGELCEVDGDVHLSVCLININLQLWHGSSTSIFKFDPRYAWGATTFYSALDTGASTTLSLCLRINTKSFMSTKCLSLWCAYEWLAWSTLIEDRHRTEVQLGSSPMEVKLRFRIIINWGQTCIRH